MVHFVLLVLHYLGFNRLFYCITSKRQKIITYHNVIDDLHFDDALHLGVCHSKSVFKFQLNEMHKSKLRFSTEVNRENSVMITFDDGYQNKFEIARPILNQLNIKAVFFITSDLVDAKEPLWIDKVLLWFSYVPENTFIIDGISFVISDNNRPKSYTQFYNHILRNYGRLDFLLSELDKLYSFSKITINDQYYSSRFIGLSSLQLNNLKTEGHLIACHSKTHSILSKLTEENLMKELEVGSSNIYNSTYFCYPFGGTDEVDQKVVSKLEKSTFSHAFINTWRFKNNYSKNTIERLSLPNTKKKYIIHAHLSGLYYFLKSIY
jgi:peptidoglycan/xylan/chitin deacetylase (PgdA/CDA1 family)